MSAQGHVTIGGADLFYAETGQPSGKGSSEPVLMLHGGMANSNYWGKVVPALSKVRRVIVMDTRGQGRSSFGSGGFGYGRFADDAVALLDHLKVSRAWIVGWSDGGVTGLDLGMRKPDRVAGLFLFGANFDVRGVAADGSSSATYRAYDRRCASEYLTLSPDRDLRRLRAALLRMWKTEPRYGASDLGRISSPTTIADGEHEEIIAPEHVRALAAAIPGSRLAIQPCVSHFALLQDPDGLAHLVLEAFAAAGESPR